MENGTQVKNLDGDLMYITPGEYGGMFLGGNGNFRSEERGGIEQYDFNISFNINDRVYLGVTVGAYAIDYNKYTFYSEDYLDNAGNSIGQNYNQFIVADSVIENGGQLIVQRFQIRL